MCCSWCGHPQSSEQGDDPEGWIHMDTLETKPAMSATAGIVSAATAGRHESPPGRVDLWIRRLNSVDPTPPAITDDERARAKRYRRSEDARAFLLRRELMRAALARRLGAEPDTFDLAVTWPGKPLLVWDGSQELDVSVSASDGIAICAVGSRAVGVDVERVRCDIDWWPVARRFFSRSEQAAIARRGPVAFYTAWTLKEAVIKARGGTLAHDLEGLDVTAALVDGSMGVRGLRVRTVDVGAGFAAAVAVADPNARIRIREWTSRAAGRDSLTGRRGDRAVA
jgi:4'-phosphopantetheinyl transferase